MDYTVISNRKTTLIKSKDNEKVKLFSKLSLSKYRKQSSLFLAEGVKLSAEAVASGLCKYLIVAESSVESESICRIVSSADDSCEIIVMPESTFCKVSTESAPQGIISVCSVPSNRLYGIGTELKKTDRIIALEGVRDPGNLGAVIRSALAFGFDCVITADCADVYSPKTVRASMGALFSIPVLECDSLASALCDLKKSGRRIFGAVLNEKSLEFGTYSLDVSDVAVIGNEGHGLSDEIKDACTHFVKIPIGEKSESLNAAVAASVIMWEYSKIH